MSAGRIVVIRPHRADRGELSLLRYIILIASSILLLSACGGGKITPTPPPDPPDPPQVQTVSPTGDVGLPGASLTLMATVEGEVDSWLWSFGPGIEPSTSTEVTPTVVLQRHGTTTATVIAANEGGESPPVSTTVIVNSPIAPGWSFTSVPIASGQVNAIAFFCIHDDRLIIDADTELAVAKVANPNVVADWATFPIDFDVEFSGVPVSAGGNLVLMGSSFDPDLGERVGTLAFATASHPMSEADWKLVQYSSKKDFPYALVKLDAGWAFLSERSGQVPRDLRLFVTWEDNPAGPANWGSYSVKPIDLFDNPEYSLFVLGDRLVMSFGTEREGFPNDKIRFGVSDSLHPEDVSEWTFHELDTDFAGSAQVSTMEVYRGKPVIAWTNGNAQLLYTSTVSYPTQPSDWISGGFGSHTGLFPDLTVAHGRLLLSSSGSYLRQTDITSFGHEGMTPWERGMPFSVVGDPVYTFKTLPYEDRLVTLFYDVNSERPILAFSDGPW